MDRFCLTCLYTIHGWTRSHLSDFSESFLREKFNNYFPSVTSLKLSYCSIHLAPKEFPVLLFRNRLSNVSLHKRV